MGQEIIEKLLPISTIRRPRFYDLIPFPQLLTLWSLPGDGFQRIFQEQYTYRGSREALSRRSRLFAYSQVLIVIFLQYTAPACCLPRVDCRMSSAACCLPRVVCRVFPAACRLPRVVCRVLSAACCLPRELLFFLKVSPHFVSFVIT